MIYKKLFIHRILTLLGLSLILLVLTLTIPALILPQVSAATGTPWRSNSTPIEYELASVNADGLTSNTMVTGTLPLDSVVAQACLAGTLAYWKLDEISGTSFDDFQSNHDAQCNPNSSNNKCPTPLPKGRVNGAQTFNGTNTGINVPPPASDSFNWGQLDSFSIELWMKGVPGKTCAGSGIPNNEVFIGRDDSSTQLHWWLGCQNTTGIASFSLGDTSGSEAFLEGPAIHDGAWHHLVGVRDGVNNVNRFYVDGVEVASASKIYTAGFGSATAALNIGWLNLSGRFHFEGTLDEVAVYTKTLSVSEIQAHYNNGVPGPGYCGGPFAPTITSTPTTDASVGQPYNYQVTAVGDPVPTYALISQPLGMTIISTTGVISWIPTIGQRGFHNVQVQASNSGGTDVQIFSIGVDVSSVYLPIIQK